VDLITGDRLDALDSDEGIALKPYQSLWITNKVDSAADDSTPDPLMGLT
jgi:sucrose phosphorylase